MAISDDKRAVSAENVRYMYRDIMKQVAGGYIEVATITWHKDATSSEVNGNAPLPVIDIKDDRFATVSGGNIQLKGCGIFVVEANTSAVASGNMPAPAANSSNIKCRLTVQARNFNGFGNESGNATVNLVDGDMYIGSYSDGGTAITPNQVTKSDALMLAVSPKDSGSLVMSAVSIGSNTYPKPDFSTVNINYTISATVKRYY